MEDLTGLLRAAKTAMSGGAHADAAAHLARAVALRPGSAELLNEYGIALASAGDFAAAASALERAAALAPAVAVIRNNLGNAFRGLGRLADAAAQYRAALDLDPDYAEAEGNFGTVLQLAGLPDLAEDAYRRALALKPADALIRTHLGTALAAQGRLAEAEAEHRAALDRAPDLADAHNNLAIVLKDGGRFTEARAAYDRARALRPGDAALHSNLVMCLCYDPAISDAALLDAHRDWAARHGLPARRRFANPPDPDRPLRIGLLSPDLRDHPVASFLDPVLTSRLPDSWRAICYADVPVPDAESERLEALTFGWCDCAGMSDAALAARIREDGIDILFDLAGHTAHNRLPLFGRRAAPVQASWIGYPATTGLATIDWRLTDARADPPGASDALHTERLLRLPDCFLCYTPPVEAPPLPEPVARPPVFGSFNNLAKIGPAVVGLWARLLLAVPEARLLLKSRQLADPDIRTRLAADFAAQGVDPARLDLHGRVASRVEHLALYGEIDLALDPFPYNGTTTTCEALWMGVPVVALAGGRHAARVGVSLLTAAGCADWIAADEAGYIAIAARLAASRPARDDLRARVVASPLMDAARFEASFGAALRQMWRDWCSRGDGTI